MKWNERNIFFLDGSGALMSMTSSALILPRFSELLGLPPSLFYGLAALAMAYALFSFTCFKFVKIIRPEYLMAVIIGNSSYCLLSFALILLHPTVTNWGRFVLTLEIAVVAAVVYLEVRVLQNSFLSKKKS